MSKKKILIVDDEVGVRQSLKMIFKDNYEVLEASDGEEALGILQEAEPDVIILDLIMPRVNGVAFLNEIKRVDRQLPVIVVSAIKDTAMGNEAMKSGAFSYLAKPFNVMELEQLVQKALTQAGQPEDTIDNKEQEMGRRKKLILLIDDDEDIYMSIKMLFKEEYLVRYAKDGRQGCEKAKMLKPDLIILDSRMAGLSGEETLLALRQFDNKVPVVFLTAYPKDIISQEGNPGNVAWFMTKPFDSAKLREIVENLINNSDSGS